MTLLRLPDEIDQVTDKIPAGTRFRSCDILPMLRRRHNGVHRKFHKDYGRTAGAADELLSFIIGGRA